MFLSSEQPAQDRKGAHRFFLLRLKLTVLKGERPTIVPNLHLEKIDWLPFSYKSKQKKINK